ncbi:MAG: S24 family peptidase [Candidatus Cloacimonetes bacterium]|nr:S24 family peptidase [Candidatus Cloacimonadota bacterium]
MNAIGLRIKELRKEKKLTQCDVSTLLGVTQSSISRYESCTGDPDSAFLASLSKSFPEVNLNWLLTGTGSMFQELIPVDAGILEDTIRLPISAEIAAGEPCEVYLDEPLGWVNIPRALLAFPPPYLVFRVTGRSMEPHILHGDIVICSQTYPAPHELSGKIMAFRTHEGITLKKLMLDDKNRVTWLMPINHEFNPMPYDEDGEELVMIGLLDIAIRSFNRE